MQPVACLIARNKAIPQKSLVRFGAKFVAVAASANRLQRDVILFDGVVIMRAYKQRIAKCVDHSSHSASDVTT